MTALPVCNCRTARHEHGTRDMYGWHSCPCVPCKAANRDYHRATAHLTRKHQWADAELARRRIAVLRGAGLSITAMADLCGIGRQQLQTIVHAPEGRVLKRVRASTLAALNAISYSDLTTVEVSGQAYVDGAATARKLRALQAAGWSLREIHRRTGIGRRSLGEILAGGNTIERTRQVIESEFLALLRADPPLATQYERSASSAARARAVLNGWTIFEDEDADYEEAA